MYKSIDEWIQDPEFVFHISIAQQLGREVLPQAINRFKIEYSEPLQSWKDGEQMGIADKVVLVRKLKMSATHVGAKRLQQLAISLEQPLDAGMDQPLDPMMTCLDEIMQKFEHL